MNEYEKELKYYFEEDVSSRFVPEFQIPEKQTPIRKKIRWENVFLAACTLGSLLLISRPGIYDNALRRSYIPMSKYETFKEEFPRVIFKGSLYFKQKQGVKK